MRTIKSRIISLCLVIALAFSGTYVTKVYANDPGDPQNPRPTPKSPSTSQVDPNHCGGCYILWLLGF
jgi:hypothetical protein